MCIVPKRSWDAIGDGKPAPEHPVCTAWREAVAARAGRAQEALSASKRGIEKAVALGLSRRVSLCIGLACWLTAAQPVSGRITESAVDLPDGAAFVAPQAEPHPASAGPQKRALLTRGEHGSGLTPLSGNTRREANAVHDRGRVADDFRMNHMLLQLQRPPEQEQALEQFLAQLHDRTSPRFHQWLSAQAFGERYGLAQADLDTIAAWLQSHGFTVNVVYANGMLMDFSGTARQVREAFHTEMHHLQVNGTKHMANMTDPQMPAALTPAVVGVVSLHDFRPQPMGQPHAQFTAGGGTSLVVPADLATIYNFTPLFATGYSGQGQTVVVLGDSNAAHPEDWHTFRSRFGLAAAYPAGTFTTIHPPSSDTNNCSDPGVVSSHALEAIVDAEWASAAAPSAAIVLASCANTPTTAGIFLALLNLLNTSPPPAIISLSYGAPESELGAAAQAMLKTVYQQAVAQGVSLFVASGDQGAASADDGDGFATHGITINGLASTPYNVAVGGTDFGDTYARTTSTYWSATNTATSGSALSYIPEIPWNNSCASELIATFLSGSGIPDSTPGFCNSVPGARFLNTVAGGGGPSGCATGTPSTNGVVSGTCAGYAKPSWQALVGNPSDGVRDVPDVALFAANGVWGHAYVVCDASRAPCTGAPDTWTRVGGTSIATPIMAGIQALINQATGSRAGNPNPVYYALAAAEYGTTGNASCNSTLGTGLASTCIFHDITQGDINVPCAFGLSALDDCYVPAGIFGVLSTSNAAYQPAYAATVGWDFATGIGTVNVANLVRAVVSSHVMTVPVSTPVPVTPAASARSSGGGGGCTLSPGTAGDPTLVNLLGVMLVFLVRRRLRRG